MQNIHTNKNIIVSIIIATFNSAKILPKVLDAIQQQTFPLQNVEILIVDGGSTDTTQKIGKKYNCTFIDNPKTEPVNAKFLGYLQAKGKYLIYLDHDEVLENKDSIKEKLKVFQENKKVKAVIGSGYKSPPNYPFINDYINEFGDPFSFFIYRLSKSYRFFLPTMKKRYQYSRDTTMYTLFDFSQVQSFPIIELCAAGSMIDGNFMKQQYPETMMNVALIPHFFYLMKNAAEIGITKNDTLVHYSSETIKKYINKINWRVKNNIYHISSMGKAGYSGRKTFYKPEHAYKQYLFLPYSLLIIPSLIDSILLINSRKDLRYTMHTILSFYTGCIIMYHYARKMLGYRPDLLSYDESVTVSQILNK